MSRRWQAPFVAASVARLIYGMASMLAPRWMAGRFAPALHGEADPRMNLRGFGGAHTGIAVHTLAQTRSASRARTALTLNILVDALDGTTTLLERRDRGGFDRVVAGGAALNLAALVCWSTTAVALARDA